MNHQRSHLPTRAWY